MDRITEARRKVEEAMHRLHHANSNIAVTAYTTALAMATAELAIVLSLQTQENNDAQANP